MLKSFSAALSFLTIIRIPFTQSILTPAELAGSFTCFPLAGIILGLIYCATARVFETIVPTLLLSVLICAFMAILTRGLHLDGLADLTDGLWGGMTPERRLEIMKDSHIGSFGVLALVLALSFKIAAIHGILTAGRLAPLLLAPVFGRFAIVAAAYGSTYARKEGLGKAFLENMGTRHLACALAFTAIAAVIPGPRYLALILPVLGLVLFVRFFTRRLIGGITGDVLGAVSETTEIIVLFLGACLPPA